MILRMRTCLNDIRNGMSDARASKMDIIYHGLRSDDPACGVCTDAIVWADDIG